MSCVQVPQKSLNTFYKKNFPPMLSLYFGYSFPLGLPNKFRKTAKVKTSNSPPKPRKIFYSAHSHPSHPSHPSHSSHLSQPSQPSHSSQPASPVSQSPPHTQLHAFAGFGSHSHPFHSSHLSHNRPHIPSSMH